MGPPRASRMVNKRSPKVNGEWPGKDVASARKSKKRKLSDVLSSQWSKEELKQFYEAFRKYGKNWKKVAGAIRHRSAEMVESLYNLNRAYLSLPEGQANAAGLMAMMTDYYNNLDGSDNDHESNYASTKAHKSVKCSRGKFHLDMSRGSHGPHVDHLQNRSATSSCRFMPLQKKYSGGLFPGSWPRVVGKRTPRVPIMCNKALVAAGASRDGGSLQVSQAPGRHEIIRSSHVRSVKEKNAESEMANSNCIGVGPDDRRLEDESSSVDALRILADVSLNIELQDLASESELFVCGKEQKVKYDIFHMFDALGSMSANPERYRSKISIQGDKRHSLISSRESNMPKPVPTNSESVNSERSNSKILVGGRGCSSIVGIDAVTEKETKVQRDAIPEENAFSEAKQGNCTVVDAVKKNKEKPLVTKIPEDEIHSDLSRAKFQQNQDIECMPPNPCENKPIDLQKQNFAADKFCDSYSGNKSDNCLMERETQGHTEIANNPEEPGGPLHTDFHEIFLPSGTLDIEQKTVVASSSKCPLGASMKQGDTTNAFVWAKDKEVTVQHAMCTQPCMSAEIQTKEADVEAIAELTCALDKNEALLNELRHMNDDASGKQEGGLLMRDSRHVKEQYNKVLKLLHDTRRQINSALFNLKQNVTCLENSASPQYMSLGNSAGPSAPPDFSSADNIINQDSGSHLVEVAMSSIQRARTMVGAAVQAMSSREEGEDTHIRIKEALDYLDKQWSGAASSIPVIGDSCPYPECGKSAYQYPTASCMYKPLTTLYASNPGVHDFPTDEAQIPSELISACVATFLMIQTTSERRYPPAEVTGILEHAVESLRPSCSQNLPIYGEIEKCMGFIKTQILALVATPGNSFPTKLTA